MPLGYSGVLEKMSKQSYRNLSCSGW